MVNAVKNGGQDYNSWIESLRKRNIGVTSVGAKEANFQDYANALSDDLKQEIISSFDNEADYELQAKLASLFGSKNVLQSGDIVSKAKAAGIQVKVQYVKTSYIVDNKKGGKYLNNKNATQGSIAVYTFSDGKGGEIKIADANGNGALETEELFMNEILTNVVSDIKPGNAGSMLSANASAGSFGASASMVDNTAALRAQWEALKAEQDKLINDQLAQFQADFKPENNTSSETKSASSKLKSIASEKIKEKHPELSDEEVESYVDAVVAKAHKADVSISKAVDLVLDSDKEEKEPAEKA